MANVPKELQRPKADHEKPFPKRPKIRGRRLNANAKFSDAEIADALWDSRGMYSLAARKLGVIWKTVRLRVEQNPDLAELVKECRELQKDRAEYRLFKAIDNGEAWAIQYYLSRQAKDRGYMDAAELRVRGELEHRHTIVPIQDVMAELEQDDDLLERARMTHPHLRLTLGDSA